MAVLVWRLLRHSGFPFSVICGSRGLPADPGLEKIAGDGSDEIRVVPFHEGALWNLARRMLYRTPFRNSLDVPDSFRGWSAAAAGAALGPGRTPADALLSFATPMSDHLAALAVLRKRPGLPWLAYFGDPWTANPMIRRDPVSMALNRRLERRVVDRADLLVFPCAEMRDLTLEDYGSAAMRKSRIVSHGYEEGLFPGDARPSPGPPYVVRHVGSLYGSRSPSDLFGALEIMTDEYPELLRRFRFEFYGYFAGSGVPAGLPDGLVSFLPSVDYLESLRLMKTAHALLVITPSEQRSGAFLPSKLIDYMGSGRPVISVCRPGAVSRIVAGLGGWTSPSGNPEALAKRIASLHEHLRAEGADPSPRPWGRKAAREPFDARAAGRTFAGFIRELF
jgi:glycosyltransferase involved in cell wall biosynthesis